MLKYLLPALLLISITALSPGPTPKKVYIKNGNVINVTTGQVLNNYDVVIVDGKIQAVEKTKKKFDTTGYKVIDATGKFIIPGLTDAHIHFFQSGGLYTRPDAIDLHYKMPYEKERQFVNDNVDDFLRRYLRCGITRVMDVGGPFYNFTIRDKHINADSLPGIYVTGPLISTVEREILSAGDPPIVKVKNAAEAIALVDKQLPFKPDYIKVWYVVTPDMTADSTFNIVKAVADETHKNNLKLLVHATELHTAKLALKAGADVLVHDVRDSVVDNEFINLMKLRHVSLIPTLEVGYNYYRVFTGKPIDEETNIRYGNPFAYSSWKDLLTIPADKIPQGFKQRVADSVMMNRKYMHIDSIQAVNLKKLWDAGINIAAGTDAGNIGTMHGTSFWHELESMRKAGLTNQQVLKSATINAAILLGQQSVFGSVDVGKTADLLILDKNPLDDIDNVKTMLYIIRNGIVMKPDDIIHETPEQLVQRQLNAYNACNINQFMATYADSIAVYNHPNTLRFQGKEAMRKRYETFFQKNPHIHCEILNRIVEGNRVIDQERVTGFSDGRKDLESIAIYEIQNGLIRKVYFISK